MHTSMRANTPHQDVGGLSTESVHISREVSVVTSRAMSPTAFARNDHAQAMFPSGTAVSITGSGSDSPIDRWNRRKSEVSFMHQRRPSSAVRVSMQDPSQLESNRESMKALADFLRTREPPPGNFMSIPSDDERSLPTFKSSAFKLFGKRKKKPKLPKFMQLPESAVSAKTRSGARHIAISIPMERDQQEARRPVSAPLRSNPLTQPSQEKAEWGAVTVLKPVAEARESGPSSRNGMNTPLSPHFPTSNDASGSDPYNLLAAYHAKSLQSHVDSHSRAQSVPSAKLDPQRPQRSYVAVPPTNMDMYRQDSGMDPRHSGGTVYSNISVASTSLSPGHTRGVSSVSTAPSAAAVKVDPPPRTSSMSKPTKPGYKERVDSSKHPEEQEQVESPLSPPKSSRESTSSSPPTVFGIAEARGYNISPVGQLGRPQMIRYTTPKPQTVPSTQKDMPVAPPLPVTVVRHPHIAVRSRSVSGSKSRDSIARSSVINHQAAGDAILVTRQSRQDKVRARKLRDIESSRTKPANRRALSEANGSPNISREPSVKPVPIPARSHKRGQVSQDLSRRKTSMTVTPIMLVANLAPYTGHVTKADLAYHQHRRSPSSRSPESAIRSPRTPAQSHATRCSIGSDTDLETILGKRRSPTQSLRSSVLETRRKERRAKRNMSLREQDMDSRMLKIENDNAVLLQTLSGIARSFGEIGRLSKESRRQRELEHSGVQPAWSPTTNEKMRRGDLAKMEPVMRELQDLAPDVGGEVHRVRGEIEFEFDHDFEG